MPQLTSVHQTASHIDLTWDDNTRSAFPLFWLRDHAQDDVSWDHRSHQREFFTASADQSMVPEHPHLDDGGDNLIMTWPDQGAPIAYPSSFLYQFARIDVRHTAPQRRWDGQSLPEDELHLNWDELTSDDHVTADGRSRLVNTIHHLGFAVLNNVPTAMASVDAVAKSMGYVRETIFGGLWQFAANEGMDDSAYTPKELRPHTDGTYSHDAPGLQMLLCCAYDAEGGDSIMVDGFAIHDKMRADHPEDAQALAEIAVPGQYIGDGVMLRAERPPFRYGHDGEIAQITFNNYDRAPFRLNDADMARFYKASKTFDTLANDPAMQWRHILNPGQMLVFDNWRILHGRAAFRGQREMAGCYVNREDYESCLRKAGLRS
ncbi:MAG: TauD/TfdA family dioxygenase [Alphaproteobacteria bacterium]|nr:TauD/TfdA family dioxygenase [Alphaproteobacteria bacterium]